MKKKPKTPLVTKTEIKEEIKAEPIKVDSVIEQPILEKKNKFLFVVGSVVTLSILIATGVLGWFYINQDNKKETVVISPTPTPDTTVLEPIVLEKDKIVFEVFNATNIKDEAKKYKKILENIGFRVKNTGNENGKFEGISLFLPKEMEDKKEILIEELKKEIPSIRYAGQNENSNIAKIVIGK